MTFPAFFLHSIQTQRIDIALAQPIKMSFGTVTKQNVVLVRLRDKDGNEGIGEASILGGPYWGNESAEGVKAAVENYLAPALMKFELVSIEAVSAFLAKTIRGNAAARGAVEMAVLDLLGKRFNISSAHLIGGPSRSEIPVAWTLSTGATATDIEEGERAIEERGHKRFKVKLGSVNVASDVARVCDIVRAFSGRATVIADVNQGWDASTALRYLPRLEDAGLEAIEQPLNAHDIDGILRLRNVISIDIIADEALGDPALAFMLAARNAVTAFALKPNRDGGAVNTKMLAAIASTAGIKLYGGTALETSVGTAANALIYSTLPNLQLGSEIFGPLRLAHDITTYSLDVKAGVLRVPTGPGLGIELDEDKIQYLAAHSNV